MAAYSYSLRSGPKSKITCVATSQQASGNQTTMPFSTSTIPAESKQPIISNPSRKCKIEEISGFDDGERQRTLLTPTATIQVVHTKDERCIIRLKKRKIKDIKPSNARLQRTLHTSTARIHTIHTKDERCIIRVNKRKLEDISSDDINSAAKTTVDSTSAHKNSKSKGHHKKRKTKDIVSSGSTRQTKGAKGTPKSKASKTQPAISTQQESNLETVGRPVDITELFTHPDHSLFDHGRVSEFVREYTKERDHRATLDSIKSEEKEHFVCHITVRLKGTSELCKGYCEIPIVDMDPDVAHYFRTRTKRLEGGYNVSDVSMGTTFENVSGKVRLGKVTGEDYIPDTYTCEAEFAHTAGSVAWRGEVHVGKRFVPAYKLVDHLGEQDCVPSIESVNEETVAHEEQLDRSCTVDFSRPVKIGLDKLDASFWTPNGEDCIESQEIQTIANELDDDRIELRIRVRNDEDSWWHMYGSMRKELTHGRSVGLPEPVPNEKSTLR